MNENDRRLLIGIGSVAVAGVSAVVFVASTITAEPSAVTPTPGEKTVIVSGPRADAMKTSGTAEPGDPLYCQFFGLWGDRRIAIVPTDDQNGVFTPPDDPQMLAWWRGGVPIGGATGRALVAGHTVSSGGGALDNLEKTDRGDLVKCMSDNALTTYSVVDVDTFSKGEYAENAENIVRQDGDPGLVVMTCEDWNGSEYLSNVVVVAELVDQEVFTH